MNIAAAMTALTVEDLDMTTKHVLLVLACRADRDGSATVTVERLAADLGSSYGTAWRALQRAVWAGYVDVDPVDNHPHQARTWRLRSRADARPRSRDYEKKVARLRQKVARPRATEGSLKRKDKEGAPARARREAAPAVAVENGHAPAGRHRDTCLCGGTGWVADKDGAVSRCPYRAEAYT